MPNISSLFVNIIFEQVLQITEKIKQARTSAGLTQGQLAKIIGVKRSTYQYWEEKTPGLDKIQLVEKALKLAPGSLLDESFVAAGIAKEPEMAYEKEKNDNYRDLYIEGLKDKVRILEDHNSFLSRNFEVSLNSIAQSQHAQLAYQKALVWYQAHIVTKGDEKKILAELGIVSSKAAEYAGVVSEKDKQGGKRSSS